MSNQHINFDFDEFEFDGKIYHVIGEAKGTYTFTKGRMYMPNGDPGYPDEEDFEIDSIDFDAFEVDENNNEKKVEDKDLLKRIESDLNDKLYDCGDWETDEPYWDDCDDGEDWEDED